MKITQDSHLDHALLPEHVEYLMARFSTRTAFFLETIELPDHLPSLPCGLHGPLVGDAPVPESECRMETRPGRKGPSRLCDRPKKLVRTLTVIGGPHSGEPCILYTAFGGPSAPREPWDETIPTADQRAESRKFWAEHALST